jgi:hypothetical protein
MVKRILLPTLEDEIFLGDPIESNPIIADYNKSDKRIEFINGSVLWFGSLEDPEMAEGPNVDFIHIDEPRLVRKLDVALKTIRRRLRGSKRGRYPIGLWATTTPDSPYSELYNAFEHPEKRYKNSKVYRFSVMDNPHLPKNFIEDVLADHSGGLAERFIYGRFAEAGGSFGFDSTIHVVNFTNRGLIKRIAYGVDFGWTNPAAIVAVCLDGDGRAYILDEFYKRRASIEELILAAKEMRKNWGRGLFYCDPSEPANIDKIKRSGLHAVGNKTKRDEGIREIGGRLKVVGDGRPRLFISKDCVNTISEFQTYDETKKENDHAVDATRYALMGLSSGRKVWVGK